MRILALTAAIVFLFIACGNDNREIQQSFENHPFDTSVISHAKSYDSMKQIILSNLPELFKSVIPKTEVSKYGPKSHYTNTFYYPSSHKIAGAKYIDELSPSLYQSLKKQFDLIGPKNITGFEIWSDSTLICYIRNTHIQKLYLDVRERLTWQNTDNQVFSKEAFIKDTLLQNNWTYHIWYDKRADLIY
jgi:hypothetical protein